MMSKLMILALLTLIPTGTPQALAEQVDLPRRCESSCECEPCGCKAFRCKVETKSPLAQEIAAPNVPTDDAVKAQ